VPGTEFNDVEDSCYLAIFKNTGAVNSGVGANSWYVGNIFMKEYYVVYDMTPRDERNEDFIQVGIGRQNNVNLFGDEHYTLG
jgi:hypothetical protein